jgi:hydroxymethylglutaryl-CoA reductase (NADPH)
VVLAMSRIATLGGPRLAEAFSRWGSWIGFERAHQRELALYRSAPEGIRRIMPRVYGVHEDPPRQAYVVVMERLGDGVILKDTAGDVRGWTVEHVDAALTGIAGAHAEWLGRERELLAQPWIGPVLDGRRMNEMRELWLAIAERNAAEFPDWIDAAAVYAIENAIAEIPDWWRELEEMPRTLVHNDFNPRNIALRADTRELVAYDWELATLHVPQRDLAELLAFTLGPDADPARVDHHVGVHRSALERASGVELDPDSWRRGYRLALRDFAITRGGLYLIAPTQSFLQRGVPTVKRLIEIEDGPDSPLSALPGLVAQQPLG